MPRKSPTKRIGEIGPVRRRLTHRSTGSFHEVLAQFCASPGLATQMRPLAEFLARRLARGLRFLSAVMLRLIGLAGEIGYSECIGRPGIA